MECRSAARFCSELRRLMAAGDSVRSEPERGSRVDVRRLVGEVSPERGDSGASSSSAAMAALCSIWRTVALCGTASDSEPPCALSCPLLFALPRPNPFTLPCPFAVLVLPFARM